MAILWCHAEAQEWDDPESLSSETSWGPGTLSTGQGLVRG